MRAQWYNSKLAVISFHVLAWFLLFLLPLLAPSKDGAMHSTNWRNALFNKGHIGFVISSVAFFYLNAHFLSPRYWNHQKRWQYVALLAVTFFVFLCVLTVLFTDDRHSAIHFHGESLLLVFPFLFIWAISTAYRFASDKVKTDQLLKEKENENLKTELSFLRSQVSPHFLFNVLNNMVALARLKSDRLEPSLIKLSGLMRYMLYESDEAKVPLAREIEYVSSYIDLQRLRFGKDMMINVHLDSNGDYHLIEPMLLIPFIENAFKHGTGLIADPEIDICLKTDRDELNFMVKNKYNETANEVKDKTSGIGLANVMRRLNLLYDKRYKLTIEKQDGWFKASLQLKLQ